MQLPPGGSVYVQAPRAADSHASGSPGIAQDKDRRPDLRMMIPESRPDQGSAGYGGLQRISVNGVSPSNNAMEILSRFRPIAPKPTTPKPGESAGSAPSDPPSTSTLSFDRTPSGKAVTSERSRVKRCRKRIGTEPLLPPTRRPKRGQTPSTVKPRAVSCKGPPAAGGIQKAVEQFAPDDKSGLQPMLPIANGGEYRVLKAGASNASHSTDLAQPTEYISVGDASEGLGGLVRPDRRKFQGFGAFKMPLVSSNNEWVSPRGASSQDASAAAAPANEGGPAVEEPAFMGRAAAASTSQPYIGRELNGVQKTKGGYDRGFDIYQKCSVDAEANRTECMRDAEMMSHNSPFPMYGAPQNMQWMIDQLSHARSNGDYSEVISDGNSRQQNTPEAPKPLVTLALLPRDSPSQSNTSSVPVRPTSSKHIPCLELSLTSDTRDWSETKPESPEELHKFSLFNNRSYEEERRNGFRETGSDRSGGTSSSSEKELRAGDILQEPLGRLSQVSSRDSGGSGASVTDTSHMDQQYAASSDPLMLSDHLSGEILWANQAYMKADAERNQRLGKAKEGPYLDVLGFPTIMSTFEFLTQQGTRTTANLWNFLKKFMKSGPSRDSSPSPLEGRADGGCNEMRTPERKNSSSTSGGDFRESPQNSRRKLITPQPIRPVGSTLTVERVFSTDHFSIPITESVERVKEELDSKAVPSVITDHKNRVSWVNSAYKQLVGQPECSWLASTMGTNSAMDSSQQSRLMGEVMLNCNEQLTKLSAVFSCSVNVQWRTNDGDETSVTLLSEVSRIENDNRSVMFVWKLDPWSRHCEAPKWPEANR